jgi:hypothetical protein
MVNKTINLSLVGIDGNAYSIMSAFSNQAKKEGWTKEEIDIVLHEAMSGDYNHLLQTIMSYTKDYDEDEYDDLENEVDYDEEE